MSINVWWVKTRLITRTAAEGMDALRYRKASIDARCYITLAFLLVGLDHDGSTHRVSCIALSDGGFWPC